MRKKMVWTLLIAAVLLASTNTEVNALKLQERDSDLQRIWDTTVADQMRDPQDELSIFQKKEALEKLEKILGIQGDFKKDGQNDMPPQFMTELYNTIADPKGETRGKNPYNANIVRSFSEKDGSSVQYFIFNISGLEQSESVLEAELHLYRKRSSPKSMPLSVLSSPYYLIRVYQVLERKSLEEPDLHRLLNVHYVGAYASGWQVFNVKQAVLSWLAGVPNYGLLVSATTIFGDQVSVNFSLRDEFPQDKQPILVLFNDDGSQILSEKTNGENEKYEEEVDKNEFEETAELDDEETEMMNSIIEYDRHRSKRYNKGQFEEPMEMVQENLPEKFLREKKSRPQARNDRSPKVYGFVSRRRSLEQRLTSMDIYERAMLREKLNLRKEENAAAEPVMEKSSTRARRESVSAPSVAAAEPANECRKPQSEPCAKRELYVNFRDIGLSTIIAPEGYAAYQCRGHCESPLSQEQKPTNHATIQGIIHKMNLASSRDVETPCCVPVNLSSISILYHDEERDGVVLKNYADMTVVSCGCR